MKLHEYQAKALFRRYGLPIPEGYVAEHSEEAAEYLSRSTFPLVIKAQVHAGGRGKAGGVRIAKSRAQGCEIVREMLG
ncbi:MAG: succinate--CoA ligase subunit beta, partial [Candidatus Electrothrix sp. EH2]|nr:succinate--CoA ligase subunit beta [Candidatus Electrothrix sp. EH2]